MPAIDKEAHVPIWFTLKIGGAETAGFFKEATGSDSESETTEIKRSMPNGKTDVIKAMGNTKWGDIELKRGIDQDKTLSELDPAGLADHSPLLDEEFYAILRDRAWLESKISRGGTSLPRVREQLERLRQSLEDQRPEPQGSAR